MLEFRIADGCAPTGNLLRHLVGDGPDDGNVGVVCWGRGYAGDEHALNARAGSANKLQQLQQFQSAGILTPPFWTQIPTAPGDFPVLGRRLAHHGGNDISLIMQPSDAALYPSDFYTRYIPRQTEYRSWIYRRRHLGTYEKRLTKPSAYRRIGANWRNGFHFDLTPSEAVPEALRDLAARSVAVLGLDFGAVDILKGVDGHFYVLEVNTAPGVEGENRQAIQSLARKIRRWEALGFPRRNGAQE